MTIGAPQHRSSGFTLIELVVVMGILGLALAIAAPRLRAPPDQITMQAAATDLGASLRRVRLAAVRTNADQTLTVDRLHRRFWTSLDGRARTLADLDVDISGAGLIDAGPDTSVIRFRPDGSACDARILLRKGTRQAAIFVDWLSGAARVEWRL